MTDKEKEAEIEKAKKELQDYYKSPRERKKLANKAKEINQEFESDESLENKTIGETSIWIESSLDRIAEESELPSFLKKPHVLGTTPKKDKYIRSQNKPSKEDRDAYKKKNDKERRDLIKQNSLATPKLSMVEVIEILRFDNNNSLWNRDLIYWTERDWKELMQIKEKHMPTVSKAIIELENEKIIEKNVIYNKPNENYEY
jgi:hypothetical protein